MAILNQLYTDTIYVYAAHSAGLDIISIQSESPLCYVLMSSGFNSVVGNNDYVYLGTTSSGVYYFPKSIISGTEVFPEDISLSVLPLNTFYLPSSQEIKSMSLYEYDLAVITSVGIDIIGMAPGKEFKSSTTVSDATKSFLTSKKEIYYLNNSDTWSLNKVTPYLCDWETPNTIYTVGDSFFIDGIGLNDLFVTENTSFNGVDNTVFVATTSGVYVYDEGITNAVDIYLNV